MDPSASSEYNRKLNQQIVQKDNMIRLLQMKLKRHEEEAAGGADARVRELESRLDERERRVTELESEVHGLQEEMETQSGVRAGAEPSARVEQLEVECENLHDQLSHLRREVTRLEADMEKKDSHIEILRGEAREGQETVDSLRQKLEQQKDGQLSTPREVMELTDGDSLFEPVSRRIRALDLPRAGAEELRGLLREIRFDLIQEARERTDESERLRQQIKDLESRLEENSALRERLQRVTDELENQRRDQTSGRAPLPAVRPEPSQGLVYGTIQMMDEFNELYSLPEASDGEDVRSRIHRMHTLADKLVRDLQIEAVAAIGQQFDTRFHEVAEYVRSRDHEEGLIIDELRRGWQRGGEVIRPALVKVVKNHHQCSNCGNDVRVGSAFCDSCGNRLESLDAPCSDLRNTAEMYWNTGRIFEDKGLTEKAREYFRQAVALEPENNHYLFSLGRVLEKAGEFGEALDCFRQIPVTDLRFEEAERHVQNILLKKGIIENLRMLGSS